MTTRTRITFLRVLAAICIVLLGCTPPAPPPDIVEPLARAGITLMGATSHLAPGSVGAFLLQVSDPITGAPIPDSQVEIGLGTVDDMIGDTVGSGATVFAGTTDERGLLEVRFDVPTEIANPEQLLTVTAATPNGMVAYQEEVYVARVHNVLVSTDKPVYQPGQTIHIRGLALDSLAMRPAHDQTLVLTVTGPGGDKLMRREQTPSAFGVVSADFVLDTQAASGDYIVQAEIGPTSSTRTVEVKPYTLPRFEVAFHSDKPYYLPGETASGTVEAHYYFGKPVAGGAVTLRGFVAGVDRFQVFEVTGRTDENGSYAYAFDVPDYFVGQLDNGTANVDLEIQVVDTANHAETIDDSVVVTEKPLLVNAAAESGFLHPGIPNIVYVDVAYPDGRAAQATLEIAIHAPSTGPAGAVSSPLPTPTGQSPSTQQSQVQIEAQIEPRVPPQTIETDAYGLARFTLVPPNNRDLILDVTARDTAGVETTQQIVLGTTGSSHGVLLRPDRASYRIGETMNLDVQVVGPPATTVYLDVIKGQQTFGLVALPVTDGRAQAAIDLDGSLLGTLELNAYVIAANGEIIRDRRLVLVDPAPATVQIETDRDLYAPGENATVSIAVAHDGAPMPGVLGVSIVDESVFSVQAQEPGFARTYFLLERELLEPRYEIHDFAGFGDDATSPYDDKPDSFRMGSRSQPAPTIAAADHAQQTALFGLFSEELERLDRDAHALAVAATPPSGPLSSSPLADPWGRAWSNRVLMALPLLGMVAYDGSRRRRSALLVLTVLATAGLIISACASAPAAPAASSAADAGAPAAFAEETTATRGVAQETRLRQFFPETLYWMPEVETDADGRAAFDVPIADSITTWRISVLASDANGNIGSAEANLRVFQDFFVEPDLPRFLTVGDELDVPISIFNYLDQPQTIRLEVAADGWFDLRGGANLAVEVGPNEVAAIYVPLRVTDFGLRDFRITATAAGGASDAVLRQVEVLPNGSVQTVSTGGRLAQEQTIDVEIPANAIPGTAQVTVKFYPGIVSQVVDGLEGLLQQPYGCFEQTSSATYPNVLVLDYLKTTGQAHPRIQFTAEQYIHLGYQRLLSFEVDGIPGGFSLFGDPPPQTMLTAYGLMEFSDMSRVSYVDPALLERTANFLLDRQNADGSWDPQGMTIESGVEQVTEGNAPATAYIVWALADAGYAASEPIQRAVAYLRKHEAQFTDPYEVALLANALLATGADAQGVLDRLADAAQPGPDDTVLWSTDLSTWLSSHGNVASIEATAMAAYALLRSGQHADMAQKAIAYLVTQRDSRGSFHTTHATILALKTLLLAAEIGGEDGDASVTVSLNGERTQSIDITGENAMVVQQLSYADLSPSGNALSIRFEGSRPMHYQVVTQYYLPWSDVSLPQPDQQAMRIDVQYDRTELQVNDTVNVVAEVELLAPGTAGTILVDLGVPPGFTPLTEDLDALVASGSTARYELTGRQILLYLTDVPSGTIYRFPYRLLARFPIRAQTPATTAYDYYAPERSAGDPPQRIVVTLGTPRP